MKSGGGFPAGAMIEAGNRKGEEGNLHRKPIRLPLPASPDAGTFQRTDRSMLLVLRELPLIGHGQGVSPLAAAGSEHGPATAGMHPLAEAMFPKPRDALRLIRALGHELLLGATRASASRCVNLKASC
jgi:hypothetical protein